MVVFLFGEVGNGEEEEVFYGAEGEEYAQVGVASQFLGVRQIAGDAGWYKVEELSMGEEEMLLEGGLVTPFKGCEVGFE